MFQLLRLSMMWFTASLRRDEARLFGDETVVATESLCNDDFLLVT